MAKKTADEKFLTGARMGAAILSPITEGIGWVMFKVTKKDKK